VFDVTSLSDTNSKRDVAFSSHYDHQMLGRSSSARHPSGPDRKLFIDGFEIFVGPGNTVPRSVKPWIQQFCSQEQYCWYVEVDTDWAGDWFNQYGMSNHFDDFDDAVALICDRRPTNWKNYKDSQIESIHQQALRIYGMLHARWICQPKGMGQMRPKYEAGLFGQCPRFLCSGTNFIPMGTTLALRRHSAKLFCPNCYDIYRPPPGLTLDGAHFGPAFPHFFLFEFPQFDRVGTFKPFEMKVFGFKLHRSGRKTVHESNKHETENME
jgi:casein kinase II subunit beta